jgi:hypothetical protein
MKLSYIHDPYAYRAKARLDAQSRSGVAPTATEMPAPEPSRTLTSRAIYERRAQQRNAGAPQHGIDLKDFCGIR